MAILDIYADIYAVSDCAGVCVCVYLQVDYGHHIKEALKVAVETKSASYYVYGCVRSFSEP